MIFVLRMDSDTDKVITHACGSTRSSTHMKASMSNAVPGLRINFMHPSFTSPFSPFH